MNASMCIPVKPKKQLLKASRYIVLAAEGSSMRQVVPSFPCSGSDPKPSGNEPANPVLYHVFADAPTFEHMAHSELSQDLICIEQQAGS